MKVIKRLEKLTLKKSLHNKVLFILFILTQGKQKIRNSAWQEFFAHCFKGIEKKYNGKKFTQNTPLPATAHVDSSLGNGDCNGSPT